MRKKFGTIGLSMNSFGFGGVGGGGVVVPPPFTPESLLSAKLVIKGSNQTGADNTVLASVLDSTGNARHGTQSDAALRASKRTTIINGKAVIRFASGHFYYSPLASDLKPITVYALVNITDANNYRTILGASGSGGFQLRMNVDNTLTVNAQAVAGVATSTGTIPIGVFVLVQFTLAANGDWAFKINNAAAGSGNSGQALTGGLTSAIGKNVSGNEPFFGDLAEIDVFSAILSTDETASMKSYYISEYGLSLP